MSTHESSVDDAILIEAEYQGADLDSRLEDNDTLIEVEQHIGDNIDIHVSSLYGNRPLHAMAHMRVITPEPDDEPDTSISRRKVSSIEKSKILQDVNIDIKPYFPTGDKLVDVKFRPI